MSMTVYSYRMAENQSQKGKTLRSRVTETLERASSGSTNPSSLMLATIVAGMAIRERTAGKKGEAKLVKHRKDGNRAGNGPNKRVMTNQSLAGQMQMHQSQNLNWNLMECG